MLILKSTYNYTLNQTNHTVGRFLIILRVLHFQLRPIASMTLFCGFLFFGELISAGTKELKNPPELVTILSDLPVSSAQKTPQQTPIDNFEDKIYIANIEPAMENGNATGLATTVVRKGIKDDNNNWIWSSHVIDSKTTEDEWHTVPSIAVDRMGFVHVAYNMHNLPWQYKVSADSENIDQFIFLGEEITKKQLTEFIKDNVTNFPELGSAVIAGNQITYPAFFKDNNKDLYITYRYAARPALKFSERAMSSAIAKYSVDDKTWSNIGTKPNLSKNDYKKKWTQWFQDPIIPKAFAMSPGWTSYHPRLTFGPKNQLNVNWMWREGIAGTELVRPCFVSSTDHIEFRDSENQLVELPATAEKCSYIGGVYEEDEFYSIGNSTINSAGEPHLILSPKTGSRKIAILKNYSWQWEDSPFGATEIFFDNNDNLWALATGLTILVRPKNEQDWFKVHEADEKIECRPKASLNDAKTVAYIYTPNCKNDTISIKRLSLDLN